MRRRRFLAGLGIALLAAACGRKAKVVSLPPGSLVLAFGDSVTFGTGAQAGEDWPSLLAARSGWRIVNGGVPGDTAGASRRCWPSTSRSWSCLNWAATISCSGVRTKR